tara:strand:- start:256 stop:525 length:270 start_codon:yes stop_codon:yes gene_type:complete
MGLLDFLTGKGTIPRHITFTLTQAGRAKAEQFGRDGRSRILTALETNGSGNIEEIAQAGRLHKGYVERHLPYLIRSGYVQPVRGDESYA